MITSRKLWLFAALIFAAGGIVGMKAHDRVSAFLHPPSPSAEYLNRIAFLSRFPPQGVVAFVGDSQVERADWNALLGRADIANFGVSGDDTSGVLNRLAAVERSGARTAVVLIGINDLFARRSPDQVAENITNIVANLSKTMRVVLVSVLPTSHEHQSLSPNVAALDVLLQKVCAAPCVYVDLVPLVGGDVLSETFTRDGLHLTPAGYAEIAAPIARAIGG